MAKMKCFSAHDKKIGIFYAPFFCAHTGQALRNWDDLCNNPDTVMGKHPGDFNLYQVGEFDEDTGVFDPFPQPVHVANAIDTKAKPEGVLPLQGIK